MSPRVTRRSSPRVTRPARYSSSRLADAQPATHHKCPALTGADCFDEPVEYVVFAAAGH